MNKEELGYLVEGYRQRYLKEVRDIFGAISILEKKDFTVENLHPIFNDNIESLNYAKFQYDCYQQELDKLNEHKST